MFKLSVSLAIIISIGVSFAALGQLVEPRTANERALVETVSKSISSCFTALGAKRGFRIVAAPPPTSELLAAVLLHASGPAVNDGYNYVLLLHAASNAAYVVQLGGFAAEQTVYGPLPFDTRCR
jgi:hypothetical protein